MAPHCGPEKYKACATAPGFQPPERFQFSSSTFFRGQLKSNRPRAVGGILGPAGMLSMSRRAAASSFWLAPSSPSGAILGPSLLCAAPPVVAVTPALRGLQP